LIADRLIECFSLFEVTDLVSEYAAELPMRVALKVIGVPDRDLESIRNWYAAWYGLFFRHTDPNRRPQMIRDIVSLHRYFQSLVSIRRKAPGEDLISHLLVAADSGNTLTDDELVVLVMHVLGAAVDTTAFSLTSILSLILRHRQLWEGLKAKANFEALVEEGLRVNQDARGISRMAMENTRISDTTIMAGASIYVMQTRCNLDGRAFAKPNHFWVQRPLPRAHLTFGHGIHYCLGAALARLEIRVALQRLALKCPSMRLVDDIAPASMDPDEVVPRIARLPVTLH
jgi:cytochrome P450